MSAPDAGSEIDPEEGTAPHAYRMAPLLVARFVGLYLLVLAVLCVAATVIVAISGITPDVIVVVVALGLVALFVGAWWLRSRAYVVRLDETGYAVRVVRGAGVRTGAWEDVQRVAADYPHDLPCLVIYRHDGATTTVPVEALAEDRDDFAHDVRRRLDRAAARRTAGS